MSVINEIRKGVVDMQAQWGDGDLRVALHARDFLDLVNEVGTGAFRATDDGLWIEGCWVDIDVLADQGAVSVEVWR